MNCMQARQEISQKVHDGQEPHAELSGHLKTCGKCRGVWEIRQELVRQFDAMRQSAATHRPSVKRRDDLMRNFSAQYPLTAQRQRRPVQHWAWALAMAAAVLLMVAVGSRVTSLWNPAQPVTMEEVSSLAGSSDGQEGFIAVPYAPALASGELMRVVRTELYPAALVSLGLDVDPAWSGKMQAELLVGEDGYPRAVRVSTDSEGVF